MGDKLPMLAFSLWRKASIIEGYGNINNPYTYSGYQFDKESGLYYLNSRMYDATTARFMQEDTYSGDANDPLSLNLYTYCSNEPIMYSDPSGHTSISKGAKGDGVVAIQEMLDKLGFNTGGADGDFGNHTQSAVTAFQQANGLQVDGIVGNQTLTYLKTLVATANAPSYAKAAAAASLVNVAIGGIKDDAILMSTKTFNNALDNITTIQHATGGGSVQTSVVNNTVVITGATIPTNTSKPAVINTSVPIVAATITAEMINFATSVSSTKTIVQPQKDTSNLQSYSNQVTSNNSLPSNGGILNTIKNVAVAVGNTWVNTGNSIIQWEDSHPAIMNTLALGMVVVGGASCLQSGNVAEISPEIAAEETNINPTLAMNLQLFANKGVGNPVVSNAETKAITSYYPPNNGALGDVERKFLMPGDTIDRFGKLGGKYFSPVGTPLDMRALPPDADLSLYRVFKVVKPFEVESSTIAPAFNKIGYGIQYYSPVSAETLLDRGIIK